MKKQEFANRLLMVEIQCLKGQLTELDNDYKSLGRMTSLDQTDETEAKMSSATKLPDALKISDFVHNGGELELERSDGESEEVSLTFSKMKIYPIFHHNTCRAF